MADPAAAAGGLTRVPRTRAGAAARNGGVAGVERHGDETVLRTTRGAEILADAVVAGLGITPSTELAETAGIRCSDGIEVDERLETSVAGIFAAGDAVRRRCPRPPPPRRVTTRAVPDAGQDLARWIPRLLGVWRASRRGAPAARARGGQGARAPHRPFARGSPAAPRPSGELLAPDELREVGAAVARLSKGLTRERELAGARYMDEERLLAAYLLFYWPVSYLQARGTISELPRRPRSVLDLGSGPGPMAFAALDAGAAEVIAADRSARALATARALAAEAGEPLATREWNPSRGRALADLAPGKRFDLVTAGHVVNELFHGPDADVRRADLLEQAAALLAPGGTLLVVEPALRDTSRALLRVRDLLVARGHAVRAPCLFRGPCPALLRDSDWCHAERPVDAPPLVAQIAKAAGLRKEAVKMSYLALAPKGEAWAEPPAGRVFRIVSEPLPSKGRLRYMGCGPEGRMGLSLQEKHVSDANRRFGSLLRGDVVEFDRAEPRGDGLALGEGSAVKVLAPAGRPVPGAGATPEG